VTGTPAILEVRDLVKHFEVGAGVRPGSRGTVRAVDGVSFTLARHRTLGLVGESGCGKTTVARCILQLERPTSGAVIFAGHELTGLPERRLRPLRRRLQVCFQDPYASLNPRMTVGQTLAEPLAVHRLTPSRAARAARVAELLAMVGLGPEHAGRYPHELSGGQRQRVGIARALALEPEVIVCDEPVSALDVSIRAQIINLLAELQGRLGIAYLVVAHDLAVVRHVSDHIAVMYLGRIVEIADRTALYERPRHPYTQALLSAVPIPDPVADTARPRTVLRGEVPSPLDPPRGCAFHPRCPIAIPECAAAVPALRQVAAGHAVACIRA
jgi:oligopeptide/dipeptide ABC transporter ATP-binding protein